MNANRRQSKKRSTVLKNSSQRIRVHLRLFAVELNSYTKDNNMPWPQVYDGKFWKAALAVQQGVRSIPQPLLVDGDTGIILAEGHDARGPGNRLLGRVSQRD